MAELPGESDMKNYVVENYENYREEDRLSTNNARRIEFLTTVRPGKNPFLTVPQEQVFTPFILQIRVTTLRQRTLLQDI